ncbi:MAG: YbjN domain-containing protein [Schwartzia sp.]|nr:YbjN domain-containing protein [Schwartzia sp. (in: firmicutes)]
MTGGENMADNEKNTVEANTKAVQFQTFLMENNINVFSTESLEDAYNTVVFRSRIESKGQILPMAIFIDTSVFTIIRTQIVTGIANEKINKIQAYLNRLNTQYKIFKYYLREDGVVYLDICLPFVDDAFDCKMIQLMLNILVQHLDAIYAEFMAEVWAKEE